MDSFILAFRDDLRFDISERLASFCSARRFCNKALYSAANLDAAAQGLTSPGVLSLGGGTNLTTMLGYIKAAAASALPTPPTTSADERDGAIVQGTIRNGVNAGVYTELFAAFSGAGNYGHDLAYAHQNYGGTYSAAATQSRLSDSGGPNAAAIAAAGVIKHGIGCHHRFVR